MARTKSREDFLQADELHVLKKMLIGGAEVTASAAELNILDGVTASTAELNILDGVTASTAELNILDGVTATAAELNIMDGVTAAKEELNTLDGAPAAATFTIGAEAGNAIPVTVQLQDAIAANLAVRGSVFAYLSDDANGDSIIAAAPDGGWAIGPAGLLIPVVAGKAAQLVSEASGNIDVSIIHAGAAKTCYLVLVMPNGKLAVSGAITFA